MCLVSVSSISVSIFPWNVRGLGSKDKKLAVKDLVSNCKADVILLQETKLGRMDRFVLRDLCHFDCPDRVCLPSKGASGGIWVIWDTGRVSVANSCVGSFLVSIKGALRGSDQDWIITCL